MPTELLDRLDAAASEAREEIYATTATSLAQGDLHAALKANRPCGPWLAMRFFAGGPGTPLPEHGQAIERIIAHEGGPADAYAVIIAGPQLPPEAPLHVLLHDAAGGALTRGGGNYFVSCLAAAAALAGIVAGSAEQAWVWFDVDDAMQGMPSFEPLRPLVHLRTRPELATSLWLRKAAWALWPRLALPAVPGLAVPQRVGDEVDREAFVAAIESLSNADLLDWVQTGLAAWDTRIAEQVEPHLTIQAIRAAVLHGDGRPPELPIPEGMLEWVRHAHTLGQHAAARLGALMLLAKRCPAQDLWLYVAFDLRASDVAVLAPHIDDLAVCAAFREAAEVIAEAPPQLRELLTQVVFPLHPATFRAAQHLRGSMSDLQALVRADRPWLTQTLAWLETLDGVDRAAPAPELTRAISAVLTEVGPLTHVTAEVLERSVLAAEPLGSGLDFLGLDALTDPGQRIVGALLLRRSAPPDQLVALAEVAAHGILDALARPLFGLRERLLEEVIVGARSAATLAWAMKGLANMWNARAAGDHEILRQSVALLTAAAEIAREAGDVVVFMGAVVNRARTLTLGLLDEPGSEYLRREAIEALDDALTYKVPPGVRASALWAKGALLSHPGATGAESDVLAAIPLLREACAIADDDHWKLDIERELSFALRVAGQVPEAVQIAQDSLNKAPADLPAQDRGLLHGHLADLLTLVREDHDAERHFKAAIRLLGAEHDGALIYVQYANLLVRRGEATEALDLLGRLPEAARLVRFDRINLQRLRGQAHRALGHAVEAENSLTKALRAAAGTTWEPLVRSEIAQLQRDRGAWEDVAAGYIEGRWPRSPTVDDHFEEVLSNQAEDLSPQLRVSAITWGRQVGRPVMVARLQEASGDIDGALTTLDGAIRAAESPEVRVRARLIRVATLPHEEIAARRAEIDAVEADAGDPLTLHGEAICNLAAACGLATAGELGWSNRALWFAQAAFGRSEGRSWRHHAARTWVGLARDRLVLCGSASTPDGCSTLRAAGAALSALAAGDQRPALEAIAWLLLAGPLTHPDRTETALWALARLDDGPLQRALRARAESIQQLLHEPTTQVVPLPSTFGATTPFDDDPPSWFVDVIVRGLRSPPPSMVYADLRPVLVAVKMRPDRADVLLTQCLLGAPDAGLDTWSAVCELARMCVENGPHGDAPWPELRATVEAFHTSGRAEVADLRDTLLAAADDATGTFLREQAARPVSSSDPRALFDRAKACMHIAKSSANADEARAAKASALADLGEVWEAWRGTDQEPDVLVSLGNAHRLAPDPDLDRAIDLYRQAERNIARGEAGLGKLHKVCCDALVQRGGDDDLRQAWDHAQRSLEHRRSGPLRAATLFSAAETAYRHPDWTDARRTVTAATLLAEAVECDVALSQQMLPRLLTLLAAWHHFGGREDEQTRIVQLLSRAYPNRCDDIERARRGAAEGPFGIPMPSPEQLADTLLLFDDPNFRVLAQVEAALMDPADLATALNNDDTPPGFGRSAEERAERAAEQREAHSTPGLTGLLATLGQGPSSILAGHLVGRFLLLAELTRRGADRLTEARAACEFAVQALKDEQVSRVFRLHALVLIADTWSPPNTVSDPVMDFALAAQLARGAVVIEGGVDSASRDSLSTLGRALRYRRGTATAADLLEARSLFARCVALGRKGQNGDVLAMDLVRLAEIEGYLGEGDEVSRLRRCEAFDREAVAVAASDGMRSLAIGGLAWTLTQMAGRLAGDDARATYTEALGHYATARELRGGEPDRHLDNNEDVCLRGLAQINGDWDKAVDMARQRVLAFSPTEKPLEHAEALHNLAEELCRRRTDGDIEAAIPLYRSALRARTPAADVRKHWQSTFGLGRALMTLIDAADEPEESWCDEAETALRAAISAAGTLGLGRELAWVAADLGRLSLHRGDSKSLDSLASEAWSAKRDALPYLLLDPESNLTEAVLAGEIAFALANHCAGEGVLAPLPGGAALGRRSSELVLRWLLRADAPYQRKLEAMFRVPGSVPAVDRLAWQAALAAGRSGEVIARLRAIHQTAPTWLRDDPSLVETERWLKAEPGSVAIGVWPGDGGALVVLLDRDSRNKAVLLLHGPTPQISEQQFAEAIRDNQHRAPFLEQVVDWGEKVLISRIRQFLGRSPKRLLWVPHGLLRLVPPSRLFPGTVVSVSASLALRPATTSRTRSRESVVVVADPDTRDGGLGAYAITGAQALSTALGGGRVLVGVGARTGPSVLAGALPNGPSVAQVLRELDHAGFAVIIAHGHTEGVDEAWIDLLTADGTAERLDIPALLRDPGAIVGLSIVLLSCETGRAGAAPDRPGGVAGALLLAGAKEVVAPLWPISLVSALTVGEALCRARAEGRDLATALAITPLASMVPSPALGPVSPERRAATAWDAAAFVTWVG